jgi:hypothetical protein
MEKYSAMPFNTLFQEYVSLYLKGYGDKKAKDIADKVNKSNKCERFLQNAALTRIQPGSDDFVVTILSSTSFSFAKAETVCLASLLLMFRWQLETGIPNRIINEIQLNSVFFKIIDKCTKFKTHVSANENFFDEFYKHIANLQS